MVLTLPVETVNYFAISEHSCDAHQNVGHTKRNVPLRLVRGEKRRSGAALCDIQHNHTRVKMLIIKGVSMVYKQITALASATVILTLPPVACSKVAEGGREL